MKLLFLQKVNEVILEICLSVLGIEIDEVLLFCQLWIVLVSESSC